ncbi:unnamed protein product [Polarella glacialis]|uniref:Uncharacterized protein n=1 Tax=Polarella glacialis TaxID=89957 RepID=A0A813HZ26_POLGL|nr:unnamed protein product [Polarella glacialis]
MTLPEHEALIDLFEADKITGPAVSDKSEGLHGDAWSLLEVTDATELPVLCHGTSSFLWSKIQIEGLRALKRNPQWPCIACVAVDLADPVNQGRGGRSSSRRGHFRRSLSGTAGESDVIVYIDAEKAMAEGVVFYWSDNDVDNKLPPRLFSGHALWSWKEHNYIGHLH